MKRASCSDGTGAVPKLPSGPQRQCDRADQAAARRWESSRNGSGWSNLNVAPFSPRCNGAMCSQPALPLPSPLLHCPPLHTCHQTLSHPHSTHTAPTYHFHFLKNNRFHFFLWSWFAPSFPLVIFFFLWWFKKTRQRTDPMVTNSSTNYNPKCLKRTHKSLLNLMQEPDGLWEGLVWGMSAGLFHPGLKAVERHLSNFLSISLLVLSNPCMTVSVQTGLSIEVKTFPQFAVPFGPKFNLLILVR